MRALGESDPLVQALDGLAALARDHDLDAIAALRVRLSEQRLRVLVAGEAKRGKSTLVNALVGREVLPAGVTPVTALPTTVRYGTEESVTAVFPQGLVGDLPLGSLGELVTERGNPGNAKNLSAVTVSIRAPLLAKGVELVDAPGTGSVYSHNTAEAVAALRTMDAAVFVLTADPPVSAAERELISQVARLSVTMFVVLNKTDHLDAGELAEVVQFTSEVVAGAAERPVRVYPVSARRALADAGDPGFAAFAADFAAYLDQQGAADLRQSVRGHARQIAGSLRDEVVLTQRAAQMREAEAADRVSAFAARLAAVRERRRDVADLAQVQERRLLDELNAAADLAQRDCTGRVSKQLTALFDGELRSATAAESERAGRSMLADLAVAEAETWRREQAGKLEAGLTLLDERLTDALRAQLDGVRQAAADLLGLELAVAVAGQRLAPDMRFFYQVAEQPGQTELLAGAVRRHLPGQHGRARAREHVLREALTLVPQQTGRARADLQYRLAESTRHLVRAAQTQYQDATDRLQRALADADHLRHATAEQVEIRMRHLADRLTAIDRLVAALGVAVQSPERAGAS